MQLNLTHVFIFTSNMFDIATVTDLYFNNLNVCVICICEHIFFFKNKTDDKFSTGDEVSNVEHSKTVVHQYSKNDIVRWLLKLDASLFFNNTIDRLRKLVTVLVI